MLRSRIRQQPQGKGLFLSLSPRYPTDNIHLGGCQGQAPEGWLLSFLRLGILEQAMYLSLGAPCFKRGFVSIIGMGPYMVVDDIGEFLHCLVHLRLRPEFIQIGAFVLQSVEVPFHRCIVVWVSCFAHALGHASGFTEFHECF